MVWVEDYILLLKSSGPYFGRALLSRKANKKSQNLFPFVKMTKDYRALDKREYLMIIRYNFC